MIIIYVRLSEDLKTHVCREERKYEGVSFISAPVSQYSGK